MNDPPFPSSLAAFSLTLLATLIGFTALQTFAPEAGVPLALALGSALGFGGVGTIMARSIPAPAERRLGFRGFPLRFALPILLMLPSVVLAGEIDNWVRPLFPKLVLPEANEPTMDAHSLQLAALQLVITVVLIQPVVEEFFFRGVIQQGLVASLGPAAGILQTAVLSGLASFGLALGGPGEAASAAAQTIFLGILLGLLRQGSGSLLAPIVASVAMSACSFVFFLGLSNIVPIPGLNAPGDHASALVLALAALPVALGAYLTVRMQRPPEPPLQTDAAMRGTLS